MHLSVVDCLPPSQIVCKLLALFPDQMYSQLLEWLSRLARNIKVHTYILHTYIHTYIHIMSIVHSYVKLDIL